MTKRKTLISFMVAVSGIMITMLWSPSSYVDARWAVEKGESFAPPESIAVAMSAPATVENLTAEASLQPRASLTEMITDKTASPNICMDMLSTTASDANIPPIAPLAIASDMLQYDGAGGSGADMRHLQVCIEHLRWMCRWEYVNGPEGSSRVKRCGYYTISIKCQRPAHD